MSSVTLSMCASLMRPRRAEAPPSRLLLPPARRVCTTRLSTPKLPAGAGAAAPSLSGRALYSGAARLELWAAAHAACACSVLEPAPHVDGSQGWRQRRHHAAGGAPLAMLAAVAQHPGTTDGEKQRSLCQIASLCVRGTINAICMHARGTDTRTLQKTTLAAQCARLSAARRCLCWDVVLTLPLVGSSP